MTRLVLAITLVSGTAFGNLGAVTRDPAIGGLTGSFSSATGAGSFAPTVDDNRTTSGFVPREKPDTKKR